MQTDNTIDLFTPVEVVESHFTEIVVNYKSPASPDTKVIRCSQDAIDIFRELWSEKIQYIEEFTVLFLNRANRVLGWSHISKGGMTGCVVDPKVIFQNALKAHANGIIACHNHPSGNTQPSESDKALTKKIKQGAQLLDFSLLDHLILTSDSYFSFADEGIL